MGDFDDLIPAKKPRNPGKREQATEFDDLIPVAGAPKDNLAAPSELSQNMAAAGLGNISAPPVLGSMPRLTVPAPSGPVIDPIAVRDRRNARNMAGSVFAEDLPSRTFGELAGDTYDRARIGVRGIASGLLEVANLPQHAINLINNAVNGYGQMLGVDGRIPMLGSHDWVRGTQAIIEEDSKAIREARTPAAIRKSAEFDQADDAISAAGYLLANPSEALGFAAEQAPQFLAAGLPGGTPGKLLGAGVFAGGQMGGQIAAENQKRVKLGQITQEQADALTAQAVANSAVVNTILPRLIPGGTTLEDALSGGVSGLSRGRGAALGLLGEGVTGGSEEALDQANQNEATGQPLGQGVGKAFALGSLLEAPMGAGAGFFSAKPNHVPQPNPAPNAAPRGTPNVDITGGVLATPEELANDAAVVEAFRAKQALGVPAEPTADLDAQIDAELLRNLPQDDAPITDAIDPDMLAALNEALAPESAASLPTAPPPPVEVAAPQTLPELGGVDGPLPQRPELAAGRRAGDAAVVGKDDTDMPESLRRWGQPQRERFGLAKAAEARKKPSFGLNGVVVDKPDPQNPNSEFTPEQVMNQLAKYQEGLKTLDGAARSPNKGKFSPSDLVSIWTRVGQTEAFVAQSRAQNPALWAAYDARQAQVATLNAGDRVLWNGDTPATVLRKFKNNWRIKSDESGQEVLVSPTALAPVPRADAAAGAQAPAVETPTMQNRDRSRAASVSQMQDIRRNPDPERLGFSRDPNTGAPMVGAGKPIPDADKGRADTVVMASGRRVPVQYAVVEADELAASHDADGRANPGYDTAPLKALNNGRTAGLQAAYASGNTDAYRQGIAADAGLHGVSAEAIASKRNPVLVRLYDPAQNTGDMGAESNATQQLGLSPVEQAQTDARALPDLAGMNWNEDGSISPAGNANFFRAWFANMGETQAASLQDAQGRPNAAALQRVRAAMVHRAYGDERLLTALAEDVNPDNRNVLAALTQAAPAFAKLDAGALPSEIRNAVVGGLELLRDASARGLSLRDAIAQGDLLGRNPDADAVAQFMADNARSAKRMADAFKAMAEYAADAEAQSATLDVFGSAPTPTVSGALSRAGVANDRIAEPAGRAEEGRRVGEQAEGERAAAGDAFALGAQAQPAAQEVAPPTSAGLFGAPSTRDILDNAQRNKDAKRDGKTGTGRTDMLAGDGELFAGPRPAQAEIPDAETAEEAEARAYWDNRGREMQATPEFQHNGWASRNARLGEEYAAAKKALDDAERPLREARYADNDRLPPGYKTIPHETRDVPNGVALIYTDAEGFERDVAYPLTPGEAADRAWRESGRTDRFAAADAREAKAAPQLEALRARVKAAQEAWDANGKSPMEPTWQREREAKAEAERKARETAAKVARTRAEKKAAKSKPAPSADRVDGNDVMESVEEVEAPTRRKRGEPMPAAEREANFRRWSNNAPLVTRDDAMGYAFKTGQKVVVEAIHGTKRPDRIGKGFNAKRATSGPMPYFTSDAVTGSSYATGKNDTSLSYEDQDFGAWFKVKVPGYRNHLSLDRAWFALPSDVRARISALAPRISTDYETGENIELRPEGHTTGIGNYDWEIKQARGNALKALIEGWLSSGTLYNDEQRFMDVLEMAGMPMDAVTFDSPFAEFPALFPVYVRMRKPLVTNDIPQEVVGALNAAAKRDRSRAAQGGADAWDKNTRTLRQWVSDFNSANGDTSYVWTSIPDKVTEVFRSLGYDGIVDMGGKGGGANHRVYIPFSEGQVKGKFNKGNFDDSKRDLLESVEDTGFYSAALQAVEEGKGAPKRGTYGDWRGWLDGAVRRGDMKQSERDWLGLDAYLSGRDTTTRQELADFIRANEVRIEEVTLGEDGAVEAEVEAWWNDEGGANEETPYGELTDAERRDARERYRDEVAEYAEGGPDTKFAQYQLPGGSNYRELLLTLPQEAAPLTADERAELDSLRSIPALKRGPLEQRRMEELQRAARDKQGGKFRSSHFAQPNILAHVRYNERTDADGKRVLFIEEIQSDWHQAGRKHGYGPKLIDGKDHAYWRQRALDLRGGDPEAYQEAAANRDALQGRNAGVPDAPFKGTDDWAMLAFKRMVRVAAEQGFDRIAWTTGTQQAERYDLSKQIEGVDWDKATNRLFVREKGAGEFVWKKLADDATESKLSDYIGKDVAEKLAAATPDKDGHRSLTGQDLKVGGSGMRGFYDKILPSAVNKWAKKFGGKVGQARLGGGSANYESLVEAAKRTGYTQAQLDAMPVAERKAIVDAQLPSVHAIDLTPQMRDAALQGMPLFQQEAAELADTDLTPAERASRDRQSVDKKGLQGELNRQRGQRDAEASGLADRVAAMLGGADIKIVYARDVGGLVGLVPQGFVGQRMDLQASRSGSNLVTAGLYVPGSISNDGKPFVVVYTGNGLPVSMQIFAAAHEIAGHDGLRKLLGPRLRAVLDMAAQNPTVRKVADSMFRTRKYAERIADPQDAMTADQAHYEVIEEALADLAAAVRTKNFQRIKDKHGVEVPKIMQSRVRAMLDAIVQRIKELFRRKDVRFSDAQVINLLENAWKAAQQDGRATMGDMAESMEEVPALQKKLADVEGGFERLRKERKFGGPEWEAVEKAAAAIRRQLFALTGDYYGRPKVKMVRPTSEELEADYDSPSDVPKNVRDWVRKNASLLTSDATDAVRWGRIADTLQDDRYPSGDMEIFRAVQDGDYIREGDWVTTERAYAEDHLRRYFGGRGKVLSETVDGRDVLVSPTGNAEEAIYAPRSMSGPIGTPESALESTEGGSLVGMDLSQTKVVGRDGKPLTVFHGSTSAIEGDYRIPAFFSEIREGAEWFAQDGGKVNAAKLDIRNPLDISTQSGSFTFIQMARKAGVKVESDIADDGKPWDFQAPEIAKHSPYDGTNVADLIYIPKVRKALEAAGYDGLKAADPLENGDHDVWVALRADQIQQQPLESTEEQTQSEDNPSILESVEYTPEQEAALTKAGMPVDRRTTLERAKAKLAEEWSKVREAARDSDALKQAVFDRFHGLRMAEAQVGLNDPALSPYLAARMSVAQAQHVEATMLYGAPKWDNGTVAIDDSTVGLLDALKPVEGKIDAWLGWMVGRRAKLLKSQGRENNLTDADIDALLSLADGNESAFKQAAAGYLKIKNAILDFAQEAGIIDPVARAAWDHAEYVPFYRAENEGTIGPGTRRGLAGQSSGIRTLKGGEQALADPLANIIRNFAKLIDASTKNRAVLLAVDQLGPRYFQPASREVQPATIPLDQVKKHLQDQGVPESTIQGMPPAALKGVQRMLSIVPPTGENVVRVMREGKAEYYEVLDPLVLRSLTAFKQPTRSLAVKPLIWFKRLLTTGVTTTAEFVGANFIRDSGSAWVMSDDRFKPGWDSLAGVVHTLRNDKTAREMMMAGGTFLGGNFYDGNPDAAAAALRRALRKRGMNSRDIEGFMGTVARSPLLLWDKWMQLSGAIENANRRAVFDAAIKAGKTRAEAAFLARDLMDFNMQGDAAFIQFFGDVLPFFNARLQGLYKLGRRAGTKEGRRAIVLRGGVIALASVALYAWNVLMYGAAWDELEEWDKDAYWHIAPGTEFHTRIPKPFEIGLAFATAPERGLEAIRHATTGEGDKPSATWDSLVRAITGTLAFNPIPQAFLPLAEQWANKRFFTGRPIESMGDDKLLPEDRGDWFTSDTMKAVGRLSGLSPKRLEHLWAGYTAGLGGYVLDTADAFTRFLQDAPERPEMAPKDFPVTGRFYRGDTPANSKYVEQFYRRFEKAEQVEQSIKDAIEKGDEARAEKLEAEHKALLGERIPSKRAKAGFLFSNVKALRKVRDGMGQLRESAEAVALSRTATPEEKRRALDEMTRQRNKLAREAVKQSGE